MHELGHFLGLNHTSDPPTIMNESECNLPTAANNVTQADAQKVKDCLTTNCRPRTIGGGVGSGPSNQNCYYDPVYMPDYGAEGQVFPRWEYEWHCY